MREFQPVMEPVALPATAAWSDTQPHPWRRYLARTLDTSVFAMVMSFVLFAVWGALEPASALKFITLLSEKSAGGRILDVMLSVLVAILPNALFIGLSGTTLGKWIFGIRITNSEGNPIGFFRGLYRELFVWVRGYGLGIPFVSLITLVMSRSRLEEAGATAWDANLSTLVSHRRESFWQHLLNAIGVLLIVAITIYSYLP